jgi:GTP cyclohydrolase I
MSSAVRAFPPPAPLRVVAPVEGPDLAGAEQAARAFLTALGVVTDVGATAGTPRRMARAYAEMLSPRSFDLTTFANDEGYDELVLARGVPVHSVCEHHMLPFLGTAHVGYLPGQRILGLSKLARVVELFARRPQVQERLTKQVAEWLQTHLQPRGAGVVIEAEHMCMTLRGVRAGGTSTITSALLGTLREDPRSRAEFLALTVPSAPRGGRHG